MPPTLVVIGLAAGALAAGVLLTFFLLGWKRTNYRFPQYVMYRFVRYLVCWQWRTELPERLTFDVSRGAVIVCNHRSSIDPFFIQAMLDRRALWMVAREYVENPAFGWFLRLCDVIPTNRNGIDIASTRSAIRQAKAGNLVGMLPEGRINTTDELLLPGRPGPVVVALRARVPIIPCYIFDPPYAGTVWSPFFRRARARVVVGNPIDLSEYHENGGKNGVAGELTLRVLKEIAALAGHPEFEPQIAPRIWKHALPTQATRTPEAIRGS